MRSDVTGLVLAGGRSRRMGTDKALLDIGGELLVHRVALRLSKMCAQVLVASGERQIERQRELRGRAPAGATDRAQGADDGLRPWMQIEDRVAGAGPLGGIVAGLATATTALLAVVAVDMPDPDLDLLARLADRCGGHAAAVPVVKGRAQPLHAIYAASARDVLIEVFDRGERSVLRAVAEIDTLFIPVPGRPRWATNLNTPSDVERYRTVE